MPIAIKEKDFTWSETEDEVNISVPLKGVKSAKADIYSTDFYIKVNFPPYFFEVDLLHAVDHISAKAAVGNGLVDFKLPKRAKGTWGKLKAEGTKEELFKRREQSQTEAFQQQQALKDERTTTARDMQSAAVKEQMSLDAADRKKLEDVKQAEKDVAVQQLVELAAEDNERLEAQLKARQEAAKKKKPKASEPEAAVAVGKDKPMRKAGKIKVHFTARHFSTAARESHAVEEKEWLDKQTAARKAVQQAKMDAKEAGVENDPLWLKDKGNELFKKGNNDGAKNAFTAAIQMDPKMAVLYSNRAACHLRVNDFYAAASDCSKALILLTPPVDENKRSRLIAYSRRAAALSGVGDLESALNDIDQALALDPANESLMADKIKIQVSMGEGSKGDDDERDDDVE